MGFIVPIIVFIVILILGSIKQIDQYERGIKFHRGKFKSIMNPGWNVVLPIFESYRKVDIRTKAVDVPEQDAITKAHGEVEAAENLNKAANTLAQNPVAVHLRTLETINDVSSDQSNTIIFALPIDVLKAFETYNKKNNNKTE